tara:strand:+ start:2822 stop:3712 length:891 start_codon:yes stop_codon:yes gene_type:complete
MKFGITVPNNWGIEEPSEVLHIGKYYEDLEFDSLWTMDHLFNIGYIGKRLNDKPYYHPLATLSCISALTTKIYLGTSILVLPYHNPVELAKYAATLDQFSAGRLILGVGVGGMVEEFEALGIPMSQRAILTNESINIMHELWENDLPSYNSTRWNFNNVTFSPKPYNSNIPIWVGGSSAGAIKRAATLGDGWHPSGITALEFAEGKSKIEEICTTINRDPNEINYSIRLDVSPDETSANPRHGLSLNGKDPLQIAEIVNTYQEKGLDHVIFAISSSDITETKLIAERISATTFDQF